jgi:Arc/MetJ-type ribon-helix-helix transcriptional regulator
MDKVTIKIPRHLYENIQVIVEDSGFSSPTEFIVYVLRDLVGEKLREVGKAETSADKQQLTQDEIGAIKKRLKSLGYL